MTIINKLTKEPIMEFTIKIKDDVLEIKRGETIKSFPLESTDEWQLRSEIDRSINSFKEEIADYLFQYKNGFDPDIERFM